MATSTENLQNEYNAIAPLAERFQTSLKEELEQLLETQKISLGVPIEHRLKKLGSILEKIERNSLSIQSITDLPDLIGLRLILLFSRDVDKTCELISKTFNVLDREDTQERLGDSQFGYQSFHYLIQLPESWLSVPSFASVGQFKAEIQIRTVAQHIWAAASHVLQYKQESNVPLPVRRSIYRVSAILETVDLEFERVLDAREAYISDVTSKGDDELLNVDLLANLLDSMLPPVNKVESEPYADLLTDLLAFQIDSTEKLASLISKHLKAALKVDKEVVQRIKSEERPVEGRILDRLKAGVYLTHVGLARRILRIEFGSKFSEYQKEKLQLRRSKKVTQTGPRKRRKGQVPSKKR